jgi:hypothetical protein
MYSNLIFLHYIMRRDRTVEDSALASMMTGDFFVTKTNFDKNDDKR